VDSGAQVSMLHTEFMPYLNMIDLKLPTLKNASSETMSLRGAAKEEFFISGTRFEDLFTMGEIAFDCILGHKFMIPNGLFIYPDPDRPALASIRDAQFYAECIQQDMACRITSINSCFIVTENRAEIEEMEDKIFYESKEQDLNLEQMINSNLLQKDKAIL
jgi:hypothetical protein